MVMYTLPFTYAVLWFCSFSGIGIGLNGRANWLDNTGTTEFDNLDNVDYHLHADASFRPSDASKCFEAFAVYSVSTNMSRECKYSGCASSGYRFDLWAMTTGNDFVFLPRQFLSKLAMCRKDLQVTEAVSCSDGELFRQFVIRVRLWFSSACVLVYAPSLCMHVCLEWARFL